LGWSWGWYCTTRAAASSRCPSCPFVHPDWRLEKEAGIIDIAKNEDPLSVPFIAQPVFYELEYVDLWILPPGDLDAVYNVPKALLKAGHVARVTKISSNPNCIYQSFVLSKPIFLVNPRGL